MFRRIAQFLRCKIEVWVQRGERQRGKSHRKTPDPAPITLSPPCKETGTSLGGQGAGREKGRSGAFREQRGSSRLALCEEGTQPRSACSPGTRALSGVCPLCQITRKPLEQQGLQGIPEIVPGPLQVGARMSHLHPDHTLWALRRQCC